MSIASLQSQVNKLETEILGLNNKIVNENRKDSIKNKQIGNIKKNLRANTSISILKSRQRQIEQLEKQRVNIKKNVLLIQKNIIKKSSDLQKKRLQLQRMENEELENRTREHLNSQKKLETIIENQNKQIEILEKNYKSEIDNNTNGSEMKEFDFFISHASEDKDDFVRELASSLRDNGFKVWYDEFELKIGDSLRKNIDRGIANSKYGIVVVSPSFVKKNWPERELDGMVAKEMNGHKVILPIWHKISLDEILKFSPSLADKLALNTSTHSMDDIIRTLKNL